MRRHLTPYRLCVGASVLVLAAVVGLNGLGSFYTDIKPEVYLAPWRMAGQYLSSWTATPYLGSPNFNVGLVPVLLVTGVLRSIGLSPEWSFKVFHFALWLTAGWGANRLVRRLSPQTSVWGGLVAGIVYVANPYDMQAGSTLAILLPYALLPWLLTAFVRALRRHQGWTWPAVFGVLFFAMSGMNVAVVPIYGLTALVPIMVFARLQWGLAWRPILTELGKCAAMVVGLSIYWLVPAQAALSTGTQIVDNSETLDGIAKVSSFPEVLRGLGMWPLYGTVNGGAWVPQNAVFVTSWVVMLLTMLWPVAALVGLRWTRGLARGVAVGCVGIAAVIMVGLFPGPDRPASPFGYAFAQFLKVPGMSAFRTSNKIGAVLALAFAVAIGVAAARVGRSLLDRAGVGELAMMMSLVVVASWVLPALTNRLYTSQMDIPSYWYVAAKAADKGDRNSAILFLPGQVRPSYRWTAQRPDDVANSLLTRQAIIPETTANASAPGGNFLAAMDDTLQSGLVPTSAMSTYARYLGVDKILLRHDVVWEQDGGARPATSAAVLANDPGLFGESNFGDPGEYTYAEGTNADSYGEQILHPVQLYDVRDPATTVRAEATGNSVLVAGDGWSIAQMSAAGLLGTRPSFRYAQGLDQASLAADLGPTHRLVITDTNARRSGIPNRLTGGNGPVLSADETPTQSRTLGTNPDDQTVLVRSGATVTATSEGGTFFDMPNAIPENVLDGDPRTSWLFGDFDRAVGQSMTITEPSPISLGRIRISQAAVGGVRIDKLTVRAGGRTITQRMPDTGYATFDFTGVTASSLTATVTSLRGKGYNLVGISDIQMTGPLAIRTLRTPVTFTNAYRGLSAAQQAAFARTPLDVLLTRLQGTASSSDDPESSLRRIVTLPDQRTFTVGAKVRVQGALEPVYDQVAGYPADVQATSSAYYFDDPTARASMAADGNGRTAWAPGNAVGGAWWQLVTPRRSISKVSIDQRQGFGTNAASDTQWATSATVSVDGKTVATVPLRKGGVATANFPAVTGTTVRVTLHGPSANVGVPPRFVSIDTGYTMRTTQPGPLDTEGRPRCVVVAQVDGQPVRMRPADQRLAGARDQGSAWQACDTLTLGGGQHRIEQASGFTLDAVTLGDTVRGRTSVPAAPVVRITGNGSSAKSMTVDASGPFNVIAGQSFDTRWTATANGKSLGKPVVLDGFSTGWRVPAGGHYKIEIRYGPQLSSNIALGASALVLLGAFVLIGFGWRRGVFADTELHDASPVPTGGSALPRPLWEVGLVVVGALFAGWGGLIAGAALVGVWRWRPRLSPRLVIYAGAGLVLASMAIYLLVLGDLRGQISADGVSKSLVPHYVAGGGLLVALAGALRAWAQRDRGRPEPAPLVPTVTEPSVAEPTDAGDPEEQPEPDSGGTPDGRPKDTDGPDTADQRGGADPQQRPDDSRRASLRSRAALSLRRIGRGRQSQQ